MTRTRLRQLMLGAIIPTTAAAVMTVGLSAATATVAHAATPSTSVVARGTGTGTGAGTVTTAKTGPVRPAFRVLAPGEHGWRIPVAKRILHVPSHSDWYGSLLRHHVVRFKAHHHLGTQPLIGPRTWSALQHLRRVERIEHSRHSILRVARAQVGDPYVYGAAGPNAFDCSGFVQYVYHHATGRLLPRVGSAQYAVGHPISRSQARPGDLIAFYSGGYIYHVAIYAGHGMMYHAPHTGTVVHKAPIYSGNVRFARLLPRA
jgi:cell wall-associated NlpC family hydrolase